MAMNFLSKNQFVEVLFSFDTTNSMYPCLATFKNSLSSVLTRLYKDIPNLRVGIIAHGDYADGYNATYNGRKVTKTYVTKEHELTTNVTLLQDFVNTVGGTFGHDNEECYELVLQKARFFNWLNGSKRILVMIGDDQPHPKDQNPYNLDWKEELKALKAKGVTVYGVQALNRQHATPFWQELAILSGGKHITLQQLSNINELVLAICYNQIGKLKDLESELVNLGKMNRPIDVIFAAISGQNSNRYSAPDLHVVEPGRFQSMYVPSDTQIDEFVSNNGLKFQTGRGFYELTKPVRVQPNKEVLLLNKTTGDMYSGDYARQLLGLGNLEVTLNPNKLSKDLTDKFTIFIQSNSNNRKLLAGTRFLYEVTGIWSYA